MKLFISIFTVLFSTSLALANSTACELSNGVPDISIVLAIDVSSSVDLAERKTIFNGYARGLVDPVVLSNLEDCLCAEIGIIVWANTVNTRTQLTLMKSQEDVLSVSNSLLSIGQTMSDQVFNTGSETFVYASVKSSSDYLLKEGDPSSKKHLIVSGDGYDSRLYAELPNMKILKEFHHDNQITVDALPLDIYYEYPENLNTQNSLPKLNHFGFSSKTQSSGSQTYIDYPSVSAFYEKEFVTTDPMGMTSVVNEEQDVREALIKILTARTCNLSS